MYAEGTEVPESRSKIEIDALLRKWKASSVATGEDEKIGGMIFFVIDKWQVRFKCPMPTRIEGAAHATRRNKLEEPTPAQIDAWIEKERRRRWRAVLLAIKAKLVSVENGIEKFEEAFLAHLVVAGNQTVGQAVLGQVEEIYRTGKLPPGGGLFLGSGT